ISLRARTKEYISHYNNQCHKLKLTLWFRRFTGVFGLLCNSLCSSLCNSLTSNSSSSNSPSLISYRTVFCRSGLCFLRYRGGLYFLLCRGDLYFLLYGGGLYFLLRRGNLLYSLYSTYSDNLNTSTPS